MLSWLKFTDHEEGSTGHLLRKLGKTVWPLTFNTKDPQVFCMIRLGKGSWKGSSKAAPIIMKYIELNISSSLMSYYDVEGKMRSNFMWSRICLPAVKPPSPASEL